MFFLEKMSLNEEVCKSKEECNHIYHIVKTWNDNKQLEGENELTDDEIK